MQYQISDYELELMKIIWANGGTALYVEIVAGLENKGQCWTKNTIITLLSRLVEKGILKTNKIGRKNKYVALLSVDDYQSYQTSQFVDKVYEGNMNSFISTLINNNLLSSKDYEELLKRWKKEVEKNE